jgi:hypothetical protein
MLVFLIQRVFHFIIISGNECSLILELYRFKIRSENILSLGEVLQVHIYTKKNHCLDFVII